MPVESARSVPASAARDVASRRARWKLGVELASAGIMAKIALGVAALTVLVAIAVAIALGKRGGEAPLGLVAGATASALAWGAGILLAFAAAAHALRRDREEGVRALFAMHGAGTRAYVAARVGGLAALLVVVVGGGAAISGAAAALVAPSTRLAAAALLGTLGAVLYAVVFSLVLAPVAFAALGARSRAGGYMWLLGVLFVPELLAGLTASILPEGWSDVVSVPSALATLRAALLPDSMDPARFARAAVVLFVVASLGVAVVLGELARVDRERVS